MEIDKAEAARAARREYQRRWRAKNPDKVKAATERYWMRVAEREAANNGESKMEVIDGIAKEGTYA